MRIPFAFILASILSPVVAWAADVPRSKDRSFEVMTKEYEAQDPADAHKKLKMHGVSGIVFRDAKGHEVNRVTFTPGDRVENGKRKVRRVTDIRISNRTFGMLDACHDQMAVQRSWSTVVFAPLSC